MKVSALITILVVLIALLILGLGVFLLVVRNSRPPAPSERKWTDPKSRD
ncbi:MAG: hypothetical protein KDD69_12375 [Bdellovibrionales bacterium]|nr:hypothetical protein [Bdellovibrionales bacterium]